MKYFFQIVIVFLLLQNLSAQKPEGNGFDPSLDLRAQPKLVVGVVVDQMCYDYITRFWDRFGKGGIKKLVSEGFNLRNNHFN